MSLATIEPGVFTPEAVSIPSPVATPLPPIGFRRMAPVFLVDRIEPCLAFWVERLGFEPRIQVKRGDDLEFVTLARDDVELMYRRRDSLCDEASAFSETSHAPWVVLFLEVDNIEDLAAKLEGESVVIPLRQSAFGTWELYVKEPSGRLVAITSRHESAADRA